MKRLKNRIETRRGKKFSGNFQPYVNDGGKDFEIKKSQKNSQKKLIFNQDEKEMKFLNNENLDSQNNQANSKNSKENPVDGGSFYSANHSRLSIQPDTSVQPVFF